MRSRHFDELMIVNPCVPGTSRVVRLGALHTWPKHGAPPSNSIGGRGLLSGVEGCACRPESAARRRRYFLGAIGRLYEIER